MLPTTAAYNSAIQATVRKFRARVEVTWVDSDIDPTIVCTANDYNRINGAAEVPSGNENLQHAADGVLTVPYKYAHLDQDIIADGSFHPFPGTVVLSAANETGWWGKTECNSNAEWIDTTTVGPTTTTALPGGTNPILTVTFANRQIDALLITGEPVYGEYPVSFEVRIYNGATLIWTETVTNSIGTDWVLNGVSWTKTLGNVPILYNCTSMQLEVIKWSRAQRVVKIVEFYTAIIETYEDDDIIDMKLLEEMLISDGSLPVGNISANELDLKLQNVEDRFFVGNTNSPIYTMLKRNRRIRAWIGTVLPPFNLDPALETVEWIPLGIFWSGDWQAEELGTYVTTSARDRMELLRKAFYEVGELEEIVTLFDLATLVMEDAKLKMPDLVYTIDAALAAITLPYGWFAKTNYFECIREICEACQGYAYVDRSGIVRINGSVPPVPATAYVISQDDYFQKLQPAKSEELVNIVEVASSPLTIQDFDDEYYKSSQNVPILIGETITQEVKYSELPFRISGVESYAQAYWVPLIDSDLTEDGTTGYFSDPALTTTALYYAWGAVVTITNNHGVNGYCKIVVSGYPLKPNKETMSAQDAASIAENGVLKYKYSDNHLIQDRVIAQNIADDLLATYVIPRKDISIDWRGNQALELIDQIQVPEYIKDGINTQGKFFIYKQQLEYDGTLKQKTDARKIAATTTTTTVGP